MAPRRRGTIQRATVRGSSASTFRKRAARCADAALAARRSVATCEVFQGLISLQKGRHSISLVAVSYRSPAWRCAASSMLRMCRLPTCVAAGNCVSSRRRTMPGEHRCTAVLVPFTCAASDVCSTGRFLRQARKRHAVEHSSHMSDAAQSDELCMAHAERNGSRAVGEQSSAGHVLADT